MTAHRQVSADTSPLPDPATARTPAEFIDRLRRLKVWAGDPSFDQLRRRSGVPASTLSDAVSTRRTRLPSLHVVRSFVRGCGATPDEIAQWESAWRALRRLPVPAADRHRDEPHQLPANVAQFVGRNLALHLLDAAQREGSPAVLVVGSPGVGKTAVALRWAHQVAGDYPDGQLFLDLRGFANEPPMAPTHALRLFLGALGIPADRVPTGVAARLALYRSLTYGRRVLVVLDNARDAEQVRLLLPGGPGCLTLVTSRDRLSGLVAREGATRLTLAPMRQEEAADLLVTLLGRDRTDRDEPAIHELARLCGYHPLALRVAAANLADQPYRSISHYAADLATGNRLAELRIAGDELAAVQGAFDLSYLALEPAAQRLFRRLATLGSTAFTADDAAMLASSPPVEAKGLLDRLVAAHLVETAVPDRFQLGELAHLYAAARHRAEDAAPAFALPFTPGVNGSADPLGGLPAMRQP